MLSKSWHFLLSNFYKILVISSIPGIATIISGGVLAMVAILGLSSGQFLPLIPTFIILIVVVAYFQAWGSLAFIAFLRSPDSVSDSFKSTRPLVFRSWWLMLLTTLITIGGLAALIIPGLVFYVWFSFALIILVDQHQGSFSALSICRNLLRGRFWPVFGRLLILLLVLAGVSLATTLLSLIPVIGILISLVIPMFTTPFAVIYIYFLYVDLHQNPSPSASSTPLFAVFCLIGLAVAVFTSFGLVSLVTHFIKTLPELMANPSTTQTLLKLLPPEYQQQFIY